MTGHTPIHHDTWLAVAWRTARAHTLLACAVAAATVAAAVGATLAQPTQYASTVTIVVQTASRADSEALTRTMVALLTSDAVGDDIRTQTGVALDAREITSRISVSRPPGSGVLEVVVTDVDRDLSRRLAEAAAPAFARRVDSQLRTAAEGDLSYSVRSWDASATTIPQPPPLRRNAALALVVGAGLAGLVVAVRERLAPRVHSARDASASIARPLVASFPKLSQTSAVAVMDAILGVVAAGDRLGWPADTSLLLVTGADDDQKSMLALATAVALAADGTRVALVDADFQRARLSKLFTAPRTAGLLDVARGETDLRSTVRAPSPSSMPEWLRPAAADAKSLRFLPAGNAGGGAGWNVTPDVLAVLARSSIVVVDAPGMPSDVPLSPLLDAADVAFAVVVDGSPVVANRMVAGVLDAHASVPTAPVYAGASRLDVVLPAPVTHVTSGPAGDAGDGASPANGTAPRPRKKKEPARRAAKRPSSRTGSQRKRGS